MEDHSIPNITSGSTQTSSPVNNTESTRKRPMAVVRPFVVQVSPEATGPAPSSFNPSTLHPFSDPGPSTSTAHLNTLAVSSSRHETASSASMRNRRSPPRNSSLAINSFTSRVARGRPTIMLIVQYLRSLIRRGLITNQLTNWREPLIVQAARDGSTGVVEALLRMRANPNSRGYNDMMPLHEAAWHGHTETLRLLLMRGADVRMTTSTGMTALHWAAEAGNYEAVELLLEAGSVLDAATVYGCTALDFAMDNGHTRIADLLRSHEDLQEI